MWPGEVTGELAEQCCALIGAVSGLGGAIGWIDPPSRAETDDWLSGVIAAVAAGDGAMCTAWREGQLAAIGLWRRDQASYFRHMAELAKLMVHPRARREAGSHRDQGACHECR